MYNKPTLQTFGSFRNLTLVGTNTDGDGGILGAVDGCNIVPINDCGRS